VGEWAARAITIGSIVFTIASLGVAVLFARKASRIRVGFDVARAAVGVIAILVMAAITNVTTPLFAIVLAITGGLALGFGQGSNLEVTSSERGFFSKRNPIGIALWGAGIVVMQAAGIASRTGMVKIGQTIAWFSVCLGVGLLVGRTSPLRGARRAIAGGGAAMLLAALILPSAAFVGGAAVPAVADTPLLTDDEACDLIAPVTSHLYAATGLLPGRDLHTRMTGVEPLAPVANAVAACKQEGYETYTGQGFVEYTVYLFASVEDAHAQYAAEVAANEAWYVHEWEEAQESMERSETVQIFIGTGPLDDYDVVGVYWITFPAIRVVMTTTGPFMLYGVVTDTLAFGYGPERPDRTREPDRFLIETLLIPMSDTAHNIDAYLAATEPPPPEPVDEEPTTPVGVAEPDEDDSASVTEDPQQDQDTALPPVTDGSADDPIEPEEAAGQAVAGLIAAAAISLITLGEASGEIGRILGGMGGGGSTTAPPQEPFIDPYDQKPLETDPETGMVWWPWDGGEGQWVNAAVVPGLLDDWNRELDAETARRVAIHDAQRDKNWSDLHDRIARSDAEDAARWATDEARLDAFDRYVGGAEGWMEKADANSLGILDRIRERVADQGYVTDADIAEARRIANDSRTYWDTMQRMNEEDWVRINQNHATIVEATAKTAAALINPIAAGGIFGAAESIYDGKGAMATVGNATLGAGLGWAGAAVGGWEPGKAVLGKIGWGSLSGSGTAAAETLIRGGTFEDAWNSAKVGFAAGGAGGLIETAATFGRPPPPDLPTIKIRSGGPRAGYDTPYNPRLRPPEYGGVGTMPSRVPTIQVRPGGPRPHYDQPLSPRHIDPNDPRYVAPGTPADQVHTPPSDWSGTPPKIIETDGPLGGRPRSDLPPVSPVDAFEGQPPTPRPSGPPSSPPPARPPVDVPDGPIPGSKSDWSRDPTEYMPMDDSPGVQPPPDLPPVSPADATGKPPLGDLPESLPPTSDQLLGQARPTMDGSEIVDKAMGQPRYPVPDDLAPQPASVSPGAAGSIDIDAEGRFVIGNRQVGALDPETGMLTNQRGERILIAMDDETHLPVGYLEQPDTPAGLAPTYNARGELAGHVDSSGRAMIDGKLTPVAIDADGKLVPYKPPPAPAGADTPSDGVVGQARIRDDAAPATASPPPQRAEVEPATGPLGRPPTGSVTGGRIEIPSVGELDIKPRIPVLDTDGAPTHFVEPGSREIHFDPDGNPLFAQRTFPAQPAIQRGGGISAPVPEVFDSSVNYHPLAGENAPPPAPPVGGSRPSGGDTS
jgi:hypothetical protein